MKSKNISASEGSFKSHKTYSPEEIFAAGGTTAFAVKMGKSPEKLVEALKKLPPAEPFSDEEWNDLLNQMANDK